jgi:hypothetical protein
MKSNIKLAASTGFDDVNWIAFLFYYERNTLRNIDGRCNRTQYTNSNRNERLLYYRFDVEDGYVVEERTEWNANDIRSWNAIFDVQSPLV